MIQVFCIRCGEELNEPGAILLDPPGWANELVVKEHLCVDCYFIVRKFISKRKLRGHKQATKRKRNAR